MGAVEDVRKLLQDVVTPDLKAVQERVSGSEKRLEAKIDALDKKLDSKIEALEEKLDLTRDLLLAKMETNETIIRTSLAELQRSLDVDRRLERIEREMSSDAAAKLERAS